MTAEITYAGRTYTLTTDHAASSYGVPVLVDADGTAFGPADVAWTGPEGGLFDSVQVSARHIVEDAARRAPCDEPLISCARRFLGLIPAA